MTTSLYTITNRLSGKKYVGISGQVTVRFRQHIAEAERGSSYRLHRALLKYGEESFDFRIIAELPSQAEAKIAERIMIALEHPEYNMTPGGDGVMTGRKHTPQARAKMSAAGKGRKRSLLARQRQSLSTKGVKRPGRTVEHSANIGAANKGKPKFSLERRKTLNAHNIGVPQTQKQQDKKRWSMIVTLATRRGECEFWT